MMESKVFSPKMVLGDNYINGVYESENSIRVLHDFRMITKINNELFERIPFEVVFTEQDIYQSAADMRRRVIDENVIYIYSGGNNHPMMGKMENLKGRAVHDVFAHLVCGCPFDFKGELNAYYEQRKHYPRQVWRTLFAEIPMQTAAYYFAGKQYNFPQRAIRATEQDMMLVEHMKEDYSHNSVLSADFLLS